MTYRKNNKSTKNSDNLLINKDNENEKQEQDNLNNVLYNKKRVIQRNTYYISNIESRDDSNNILYSKNLDVYKRIHTFLYNKIYEDKRVQVLTLRVKPVVKMLWDTLSIEEKRLLREAIEKLILGYVDQSMQETRIINVNINVNKIENNVKAEAKAESKLKINLKEITKLVERLYHLSQDNPRMPPLQKDLIKRLYKKIMAIEN